MTLMLCHRSEGVNYLGSCRNLIFTVVPGYSVGIFSGGNAEDLGRHKDCWIWR